MGELEGIKGMFFENCISIWMGWLKSEGEIGKAREKGEETKHNNKGQIVEKEEVGLL